MNPVFTANYLIHESRLNEVLKKLTRLGAIAEKLGLPPFVVEPGAEQFKKRPGQGSELDRYVEVAFSGSQPVIAGWRFLAKIDHDEQGNIVQGFGSDEADPRFRTCKPNCDHCNTNRQRKETFVVIDDVLGKQLQVGSTCLDDFIGGHNDPKMLLELMNGLGRITLTGKEPFVDFDEDGFMVGGGAKAYGVEALMALQVACAVIRKDGRYIRSDDTDVEARVISTKDTVSSLLSKRSKLGDLLIGPDIEEANRVFEWMASPEEGKAISTYESNLRMIAKRGAIDPKKHLGLLVSAPAAYARAQAELKQKADSNYFSQPDEKLVQRKVIFEHSKSFPTEWGVGYNVLMRDIETGGAIKWKTSSPLDMMRGKRYLINATVKGHEEYQGVKQTVFTRVSCPDLKALESLNNPTLLDEIADGKVLKKYLKKLVDFNVCDGEGYSPLVRAGMFANDDKPDTWLPLINGLLEGGADPLHESGFSPAYRHPLDLAMAYGGGSVALTERYLQHLQAQGVDIGGIDTLLCRPEGMNSNAYSFVNSKEAEVKLALAEQYGLSIDPQIYAMMGLGSPEGAQDDDDDVFEAHLPPDTDSAPNEPSYEPYEPIAALDDESTGFERWGESLLDEDDEPESDMPAKASQMSLGF